MSKPMRYLVAGIIVMLVVSTGFAAALAGRRITASAPSDPNRQERITVQGMGHSEGTPDVMRLNLSVDLSRPTIQAALDASNTATNRVITQLRRHGVAQKDIQTVWLSITRNYAYPKGRPPRLTGFRVSNSLIAKLRDLKHAGSTIEAAATAAGNYARIDGVSFDLEDNLALLKSARDTAMSDARAKAEQYAKDSGRHLGKAVVITEVQQPSYQPTFGAPILAGSIAASAPPSYVPISTGVQQVTVLVTVVYTFA